MLNGQVAVTIFTLMRTPLGMIAHLDVTLVLPLAEVPQGVGVSGRLHPLDHLQIKLV